MVTTYGGEIKMRKEDEREIKRVKISKQRQISIPKEYYTALELREEALVEYTGKSIIIRPVTEENVDFSEFILRDLIEKGYAGEELINQFKNIKSEIPNALNNMIEETRHESFVTGNLDEYLDSYDEEGENV